MSDDTLREAGKVVSVVARSIAFRDNAGDVLAVFTTWGFAAFALLLVAAVFGTGVARSRAAVPAVVGGLASFAAAAVGLVVKRARHS